MAIAMIRRRFIPSRCLVDDAFKDRLCMLMATGLFASICLSSWFGPRIGIGGGSVTVCYGIPRRRAV
jgi:hypothetical protein